MSTETVTAPERVIGGPPEEKLVSLFFAVYKNARIIEANHPTYVNQCQKFRQQLAAVAADDQVAFKIVSGRYFVNGRITRYDGRGLTGVEQVLDDWQVLGLAGVVFSTDMTFEDIGAFFKFMATIKPGSVNLQELSERLKKHGLPFLTLLSAEEAQQATGLPMQEMRMQFRVSARRTFFRALQTVEEVMHASRQDSSISPARTKRVVHSLIDHITRDESSMLELTAIKNFDDYTFAHSTNVCIYSLTLGLRLELDRPRLSQLGFAALFHDIGKVRLPAELIRKPDAFDEDDWLQMQRHPMLGAKTLLKNLKLDEHSARAARAAFEHHINQDFTGYPKLQNDQRPPNLFSCIISIADTFDALCSGRVYMRDHFAPDDALQRMRFQMGAKFDPFLFQIFNGIVGVYPAGSLVLLSTDEIALILAGNERQPSRPYIKIVGNRRGLLSQSLWVDLSDPAHQERKIVRLIDPERYSLDVKAFILAD